MLIKPPDDKLMSIEEFSFIRNCNKRKKRHISYQKKSSDIAYKSESTHMFQVNILNIKSKFDPFEGK